MKTALLAFFLTTLCAVFACAAAYAAKGADATAQQNARTSSQSADHAPAAKKDNRRGLAIVAKANRPQPLPKNQKHSTNRQLTGGQRSATRADGMPITNKAATTARSVQLSMASRNSAPSPNMVRHRNPNPAILGGSKSSNAVKTGAINGSRMSRKP